MTKLEELKAAYDAHEAVFDACDAYQNEQMNYDQFRKLHQMRRGNKAALSYAFYKMSLKDPKT